MISLVRARTIEAIPEKFRGAQKRAQELELLQELRATLIDPSKKLEFQTSYWKSAKDQLRNV